MNIEDGYELQIGDKIICKHTFGNNVHIVTRVTKKYAFVQYSDIAEGKFPRIVDFWFQSLPKQTWNTKTYSIKKAIPNTPIICNNEKGEL